MEHQTVSNHSLTATILKATLFAANKHRDQRRKNVGRTPYINHLLTVANILWFEGGIRDTDVLIAGILHDTIEDTDTHFEELECLFGQKVAKIVKEVSDDWSLPKWKRKQKQIESAPHISFAAKLVKLADKISNLRDVVNTPPKGWSQQRRDEYFHWARAVIGGLRGTNSRLEEAFDHVCARYFSMTAPRFPGLNNSVDLPKKPPATGSGTKKKRVLGYSQGSQPGPCLIMMGGLHGNEVAGLRAIQTVFAKLQQQKVPHKGTLWGIAGNLSAIGAGVRFLDEDLNRVWVRDDSNGFHPANGHVEMRERKELLALFEAIIGETRQPILFLDLHTFSSNGSPFVIATDTTISANLLKGFPYPAIYRLDDYIVGTLGSYLHQRGHSMLAFEGGSHRDPEAAINLETFIWHILTTAGVADPVHIPRPRAAFDSAEKTKNLRLRVFHRHPVHPGDGFRMQSGFTTIQAVKKGQLLASDNQGPILATHDAYLLMPLYHPMGEDGFFLASAQDEI